MVVLFYMYHTILIAYDVQGNLYDGWLSFSQPMPLVISEKPPSYGWFTSNVQEAAGLDYYLDPFGSTINHSRVLIPI